jgi:hypothetical protein
MFPSSVESLSKGWVAPPELNRSIPREVRLTTRGVAMTVLALNLGLIGMGGGLALGYYGQHIREKVGLIQTTGKTAQGVVTRLWRIGGKSPSDRVEYQFDHPGGTVTNSAELSGEHWMALSVGSPIAIQYLPSDPSQNFPVDDPTGGPPLAAAAFIGALTMFAAVMTYRRVVIERRALETFRPAPGRVTRNWRGKSNQISYEFAGMDRSPTTGRACYPRTEVGTPICVLYDPENPRKSVLYPCQLVVVAGSY